MTATTTLSSTFQISIPKAVREAQHWEAGQEFVFIPKGKGVLFNGQAWRNLRQRTRCPSVPCLPPRFSLCNEPFLFRLSKTESG